LTNLIGNIILQVGRVERLYRETRHIDAADIGLQQIKKTETGMFFYMWRKGMIQTDAISSKLANRALQP